MTIGIRTALGRSLLACIVILSIAVADAQLSRSARRPDIPSLRKYIQEAVNNKTPHRSSLQDKINQLKYDNKWGNVTTIVRGYGYPCEDHWTVTPDGYILSLQHIPHGLRNKDVTNKPVVYLQHSAVDSSVGWVLNLPTESLAYILADAGFDVWLGNTRGNLYTLRNTHMNASNPAFWNFSFDEVAKYDFPTLLNYVFNNSQATSLSYIAHSEGSTVAFIGCLNHPELAQRINTLITLSPVAFLGNITSYLLIALAELRTDEVFQLLGYAELYDPNGSLLADVLSAVCYVLPSVCSDLVGSIFGYSSNFNLTRTSYYFHYEPSPTSVKNIAHLAQLVRSGQWQMYDYGSPTLNLLHYNQTTPPIYDITKFPSYIPLAIFYGGLDAIADPMDVKRLIDTLPPGFPYPLYTHFQPDYAHLDPLFDDEAYIKIYPQIIDLLKTHSP